MQSPEEKLKKCGLTGNEAKVYLGLLKHDLINGCGTHMATSF